MARVNLANGHHGTVWVCQTATFGEGEEREWDSFATHAAFATRTKAMGRASRLAHDYAGVLCLLLAVDGSDGISVDVQPRVYHGRDYEPYAVTDSWEVVPGKARHRVAWRRALRRRAPDAHGVGGRTDGKPLYVFCPSGHAKDGLRTGDRVRKPLSPVRRRPRSLRRGTATAGRGPARHRRYRYRRARHSRVPYTFVP